MKNFDEYKAQAADLKTHLGDILTELDNLASHAQNLADCLSDLHGEIDEADTSAQILVDHVELVKPKKQPKLGVKHFRMLAILNEYGDVHRNHVALLLGMKPASVDQLANQIRKHHLADLRSRKGVYKLHALGDDVSTNENFKLV